MRTPAELVDHGRKRERGIGAAASNHNIGSGGERFSQRERADIRVGTEDPRANSGDRFPGVHVAQLVAFVEKFIDAREDIVAEHDRHLESRRMLQNGVGASNGIHSARIGNHFDVVGAQLIFETSDERRKVARVAEIGVAFLLLLQNGHRDFGQIIEDQVIDGTILNEAHGRFEPVAPEALSVGDADHLKRLQGKGYGARS